MEPLDTIINEVISREGGATNDPLDKGGRTAYGISEKSHPEAWADGKVTLDEAREIYLKRYVEGPGFSKIENFRLMSQLVDFGVNSGPSVAIKALQRALKLPEDGILGSATLEAVAVTPVATLNNLIVEERVKILCKICVKNPTQLRFLVGWVTRALEFLV